jgi:anti-sigma regulatory factor (Ser/Thr protein kinase)
MMLRMADRVSIAANADNQAEIRRFVREAAAALGVDAQTVCSLELAVDEAACNVITHGYQGRAGMIDVEVERDGDAVIIRLRDSAPPFDPTRVPDPDLTLPPQERRLGGMGVYLIRKSVDEMLYRATPEGGNELTLKKRLNKEQDDGYCHL